MAMGSMAMYRIRLFAQVYNTSWEYRAPTEEVIYHILDRSVTELIYHVLDRSGF